MNRENKIKELAKEFDRLHDDVARWHWVQKNQRSGIKVEFGRGVATLHFLGDDSGAYDKLFDGGVMHTNGLEDLLKAIGINYEIY